MKRITSFFAVLLIAMTAFATGISGGEKFYLDLATNKPASKSSNYWPATVVFSNGETTSASSTLEYNSTDFYEIEVPEGTWTDVSITLTKYYKINLTFDGVNNCWISNKASGSSDLFTYTNTSGTWTTYAAEPEEPAEPATVIPAGTTIYLDVTLNTTWQKALTATLSDGTNTIDVKVDTVTIKNKKPTVHSITIPEEGNWTSIAFKVSSFSLNLTEYDGRNAFKLYYRDSFVGGAAALALTDLDGVWMEYGQTIAGTNIAAKATLYFDPTALGDACDNYQVVFLDNLGVLSSKRVVAESLAPLAEGKYMVVNPIATPAASFSIFCYKGTDFVTRIDNVVWDGEGNLFTINADGTGAWSSFAAPEKVITATWTMEEGASVTGFSSVRVTFGGIDAQNRVLGQSATKVTYAGSTAATFYKVENGTRTAVAVEENSGHIAGKLDYTEIDNFTYEFSVGEYFERFEEGYMRPGDYCIVINGTNLTIDPKVNNKAIKGSGEFVLNFTIANDKVFLEPTEASYELTPSSRVVNEISEVILEFEAPIEFVEGRSATPDPKSWPFIQGASVGGVYYPMNCEIIDDYELKLTIASEYVEGVDKITAEGLYTITIPEGMLSYGDPMINKEITLSYTIGTAMPANGVIYFDPAGKFTESLSVRFIGADGSVKDAADVINLGEIYRITMPAGNEWMRFEVDAWGDDPATTESNFVQLYLVSGLVYTGEYNMFTLNADAPNQATAENGVWSNHVVQPIQGGSVFFYSLAGSAYFSEAEEGMFAWKVFFVNAEGTEAEVEMELIDGAMYKIVAPEGTWDMLRISLYAAASGREVNRLYLENDGEHNMFKLGEDASPYALVGSWDVYNTEVIATWGIEEGAVLESFTGVTVTFSGLDPRGRKVDGTEVTKVYPLISTTPTFFLVNEDGTTTPVVADENDSYSGILTCSASGVTSTLSLGTDRYALVDGAFLKNGNYRIVLPANKVQYQPKVDGANVFGDKDFVLNFSIVNDYVEPEPATEIEVPFTVSVENNSTVAELSEIVITYSDVARIRVSEPMAPQSPATWVFLSQTLVDETGNVTASQAMAPLYWQQVSANSFKVMVNLSAIGGPETLTMEGTYSIDVPAGLVMFSETTVNKAFSLYYTIKAAGEDGPTVDVENLTLSNIFVQNGMIMADGEFEIFTITGQNVTDMNGNLQNGVYVVRNANAVTKVIVK